MRKKYERTSLVHSGLDCLQGFQIDEAVFILLGEKIGETPSNVDHYKLALFIYHRLFGLFEHPLSKNARNPPLWELVGFEGTPAVGSEQQLDALISVLDQLIVTERKVAERLQADSRGLDKSLSTLRAEINYAIASLKLRKPCDLVPFI